MATTDFLLRPAMQVPRTQSSAPDNAANQRSSAAGQSFSAVYEQQRSNKANQQQAQQTKQRNAAVQQEKQQQAARHTSAKNTTPSVKDKPSGPVKQPAEAKAKGAESRENTTDTAHAATSEGSAVEPSGNVLPPEATQHVENAEEELLDPLLLMAMTFLPIEPTADATFEDVELDSSVLTGQAKVSLQASTELTDSGAELAENDELNLQIKPDKIDTSASPEKAALLSSASGKTGEVLVEKGTTDKSAGAALLETAKAAPDTLLNTKAVTPTETIRADMQPRPESLLAAQQTRAVPGAAVAMQQPGWTQDVTDKVMWMSSQNLKSAEIKLDPAELGRLDIKIDMSQEHTQVTFTSANAGVRDSLEAQMHRLRELLAQQGMADVDVNVSDQSQQQADAQARELAQGRNGANTGTDGGEERQQQVTPLREQHDGRLGLVDYYA